MGDKHTSKDCVEALKSSLLKITYDKKIILAVIFFAITLIAIWKFHLQIEWYNNAHGRISSIKPREQAITYMIYATILTVIAYVVIVIRETLKLLRTNKPKNS